jgi:hypothetical protein
MQYSRILISAKGTSWTDIKQAEVEEIHNNNNKKLAEF